MPFFWRLKAMWKSLYLFPCVGLIACASSAPVKIGADTYYSSKTNTAGIFGDVGAVAGALMAEGNQLCESQGKEFELVTQNMTQNIPGVRFGGASVTFKCVVKAGSPVMRPDKGVTTIETK
jgi:hypothetical protein